MGLADQKFDSFNQWVTYASRWLTDHPEYDGQYFRAICFDSAGNIVKNGGDFKVAFFPVYWIWPDQNLFNMIDSIERTKK